MLTINLNCMKAKNVGGQSVYEGVMIRAGDRYAVAVRNSNGEIITKSERINELVKKYPLLRLPILRGIAGFYETLSLGIISLNWSIELFENHRKSSKAGKFFTYLIAIVIALALFLVLPLGISNIIGLRNQPFLFNITSGVIRVAIFFLYIYIIGKSEEIRRYFQYHGAEHKSIYAYERGKELTIENIKAESPLHPRCGTSFIFITIIFAILFFSIVDGLYGIIFHLSPPIKIRIVVHLILLPIMVGLSWEILKKAGELYNRNRIVRVIIYPGLLFQKITALEPNNEQIEVAIKALTLAVGGEND